MAGLVSTKGYGIGLPSSNRVVSPFSVTIYDADGIEIGFITDFTPDSTRRLERVRHLNAYDAGRIIEQVPGPEDPSISVSGFVLYSDDVANPQSLIGRLTRELGVAVFEALNQQRIPFTIVKEVIHPATGAGYKVIYHECWLARYSETWSVRNLVVTGSASIQPTYHEVVNITREVGGANGVGGKLPLERTVV